MDSNARDQFERTPLYYAIEEGFPECVKVLLRNQADPELAVDETGQKPVHLAVRNDKRQILKILLDFGARPDEATPDGVTPLLIAVNKDYAHILQLLMLYNINIEREDEENNNLMHLIAVSKASKCARFLLKEQSNSKARHMIFRTNYDDKTPIKIARDNHSQEVLQLLIQYVPIDFFSKDPSIFHALYNDKQYDILKLIFTRMSQPLTEREHLIACDPSFLDSNEQGEDPYSKKFSHLLPSFLHKLIDCRDNELKEHPLVKIAVRNKLKVYRLWYLFTFCVFFLFLITLGIALILASYECDGMVAITSSSFSNFVTDDSNRKLRLVCEIFVLAYSVNLFVNEIIEFILVWSHYYKDKKTVYLKEREDRDQFQKKKDLPDLDLSNIRVLVSSSTFFNEVDRRLIYILGSSFTYISGNVIDISGIISLALLVAFRYTTNTNVNTYQWWFAALTFIIYTLTLFKYTKIIPALGSYVETVTHVFYRDIPRFLVILVIVVAAFVGGIHLAARQEVPRSVISNGMYESPGFPEGSLNCSNANGTIVPSTTVSWLNGITNIDYNLLRPLLTGTFFILEDFGVDDIQSALLNMNIAFTVIYFCFAFAIIVVLSNILIAQLSQTYAEFNKQNEFHYQLELVVSIELKSNIAFFMGKYFRRFALISEVNVPYKVWSDLEDKSPGRDIERRITFIEENIERNFQILSEESSKSAQRKDTLDAIGERLGDVGGKLDVVKSFVQDPFQATTGRRRKLNSTDSSRMSLRDSSSFSYPDPAKVEDRLISLETKVNRIIQLLEQTPKF